MLFKYQAKSPEGEVQNGNIDAASLELAVTSLQRKNLIIVSIKPVEEQISFFSKGFSLFSRVKSRDVVILSRQLATLFEAKIPIVDAFKVLMVEVENARLKKVLADVLDDIQGGVSISQALSRHPDVFSKSYVNMVRSGEESGKLEEVFMFLADYLERSYELTSKARSALIYPAFVISAFVIVMILMFTIIIPKLSGILLESGQALPLYTKLVIGTSDFLRRFGVLFLFLLAAASVFVWRYSRTEKGRLAVARSQLSLPVVGELYRKLYISRIADNLQMLLAGGVPVVRALEISSEAVANPVYRSIINETIDFVKSGGSIADAFSRYEDIPPLFGQMVRIGEQTGGLDQILSNIANFYRKEVERVIANFINLIEPALIIVLGGGIGLLVASIFIPIYNIATSIS